MITLSTAALAGGEGKKVAQITGKVIDASTAEGVAGAVVEVEGTDIKVYTDFEGNFILPAMVEGSYTIKSSSISYSEVKLRGIKAGADLPANVEMKLHAN